MTPPAATAGRALPRTAVPRAPRRVSGPARPKRSGAATGRRHGAASAADPFAIRALRRGRLLADSRLLDRLVRGRLWIPLVAVGLMGIVFMQVSMLKLNAGIGRAVQSASTLERQNANLRSDVSRMESGDRIDSVAHDLGMVVPADGGEHYVRAGGSATAAAAADHMTSPDPDALARAQAATAATAAQAAATASTTTATRAPAASPAGPSAASAAAAPPASPQTSTAAASGQTQTPPPAVQQTPSTTQPPAGATAAPTVTPSPPAAATTAAASAGGAVAPTGY